ncbi:PIG-L deacetylase family protein [Chloroflexota bacterium]
MAVKPAYAVAFAPHPDDEGGAGGTIARWAREGKDVILVICTNGDKGTNDPEVKPEELAKIRETEQRAAAEQLGVREVIFLGFPDQSLSYTPELKRAITRIIRIYQPELVMTTDPHRRYMSHPDHRSTGQAVLEAVSLYSRNLYAYPELYFEEGLELHRVTEVLLWGAEDTNYFSDITETFEIKMNATSCHKSQFGDNPTPERIERMRERAKTVAEKEEYELGEAFHKIEMRQPPPPRPEK